jgi:ornithine carbamoyltransferase
MKRPRHFLSLRDYTRQEILDLLARAVEIKKSIPGPRGPKPLEGKSVALIFEKPSTRTRVSFEVGIHQFGGQALYLNTKDIQLGRGEPIRDTARVLSRYVDAIVIRTFGHDILDEFAKWSLVPIINGLSDYLHPCQILGDLMTLTEKGIKIENIRAAWIGDGNNVANSWIIAAQKLGFPLTLACPPGYDPTVAYSNELVSVTRDPLEAIKDANVVSTDVWASMGQESEIDERSQVFRGFQLNMDLLKYAANPVYVLHCLPAHRGEEITDEVMESEHSLLWDQAENRLHVQKAVMELLIN